MSVPTSESQGWGPSLLGGLPGAQSPSCTGVRCCGVGVSGGAARKTQPTQPFGDGPRPGLWGRGDSEAWGSSALICAWWPGVPRGDVAGLAVLPVSIGHRGYHLVDARMGWGDRKALTGLEDE